MGYFDKIAATAFKEGKNGETLYFPNGILGKGRLVEDPVRKEKLFKFHKRLNKYFLPLCILYGLLLGLSGGVSLNGFMPIIIIGLVVIMRQQILIRGLPVKNEKLSAKEAMTSTSKALHPAWVPVMFVAGIIGILLSLSIPFFFEKSFNELLGLVVITLTLGIVSLGISLYLYKIQKI
ncbi:hypothetical protein [Sulfuriflexus mobilis]|uniref:hypothetical protein n=1 Tax=Sulfuriflexus mobilis TaxID=1811807 RepID=UPI000F827D42|nr:hypothetical protein [Sulfuriflexus mobilis]